jgi:alcohol dehydrogenase (cytochrome c)
MLASKRHASPIFTPPGPPGTEIGPFAGLLLLPGGAPIPMVPVSEITIEPGVLGGSEWSPVSFNPRLGLAFVAGNVAPMSFTAVPEQAPTPGRLNLGGWWSFTLDQAATDWSGMFSAIDVSTGKVRWHQPSDGLLVGGSCATAGDLVFAGEQQARPGSSIGFTTYFTAFDARTGDRLWRYHLPGDVGVSAPCVTFRADGEQFVAVAAGGSYLPGRREIMPKGDTLYVFGLPK